MNEREDTSHSVRQHLPGPDKLITQADWLLFDTALKEGRKPKWRFRVQQKLRRCIQKIESWFS